MIMKNLIMRFVVEEALSNIVNGLQGEIQNRSLQY